MALPFDVWLDTELRIVHSRFECPSAVVPSKYGYLKRETVFTVQRAREIDGIYRPCDGCQKSLEKKRDTTPAKMFKYRQRRPDA